jgi:glycosyltransferase involved in cell wall biosynthesis
MTKSKRDIRVLYSFPHRLGAERICYTAWQQVNGLARAGSQVLAMPGSLERPVDPTVRVNPTLALGRLRLPYRLLGSRRAFALHDHIVARRLASLRNQIDIVHVWPQGALRTTRVARKLGIPVVMERPNAHTRFAYEAVREECERIGVMLPPDHEHAFNEDILEVEEAEFRAADRLLCPSDFVVKTFVDKGFPLSQLARHIYGYDEKTYYPAQREAHDRPGLTMLFVGVCAVRKGLHVALEAWLSSGAQHTGTFLIAGEFLPEYQSKLATMLAHPSVEVLGHRTDVPELMRRSDLLVLPSIEEGFGLVCTEAMGSGCVPLVSDACTDLCRHMENSLVHRVRDVASLTEHIRLLNENRGLLQSLRERGLGLAPEITWDAAGKRLLDVYAETISRHSAIQAAPSSGHDETAYPVGEVL